MPAKKKYLTKSPWIRTAKLLVGVIGGYAVTVSFHLMLSRVLDRDSVIVTSFITGYVLWAFLLLWTYIAKRFWLVPVQYLVLTLLFWGAFHYIPVTHG